jgi:hypothetical protein
LCGAMAMSMVDIRMTRSLHLRGGYIRSGLEGEGPWEDDSNGQASIEEVTGVATGTTHMRISAPIVTVRQMFRTSHPTQFFVEAGGGRGTVKVNFHGTFAGSDSYGDTFSVPDVTDTVRQHIPVVIADAGIMRHVHGGWFIFGYQCNTGSSAVFGGFKLDPKDFFGRR